MLRYFAPHEASGIVTLASPADAALFGAVDGFVLGGPRAPVHVAVARDLAGDLFLARDDELPDSVRAAVLHNELTKKPRFVDVNEVWLFIAELLEQAADTPGENDPVHLYGRLCGPFGGSMFASAPAPDGSLVATTGAFAQNGKLTITRGDLLKGFVDGAPHAFVVDGDAAHGGSVHHAAVPGDAQEQIAQGKGCVFCYPLLPVDVAAGAASSGNEAAALHVFAALCRALQDDLVAHPRHPRSSPAAAFAARALPVAHRADVVAALEAEGFTVQGDVAERRTGILSVERRPVPREWSTSDIVDVGSAALQALTASAFPDARAQALWSRIHDKAPTAATSSSTQPRVPVRPHRVVEQPYRKSDPDWMKDFDAAPASTTKTKAPTQQAPRRTRVDPPKRDTKAAPDWMKDFE